MAHISFKIPLLFHRSIHLSFRGSNKIESIDLALIRSYIKNHRQWEEEEEVLKLMDGWWWGILYLSLGTEGVDLAVEVHS